MRHVTVLHVTQRNLWTNISIVTTASLPYLHSRCLGSLQRVAPYPILEVLSYILLLTCRLQWVPNPYIWSSTRESCCHAFINIPDVLTCRLQCVLRCTWNEYTHSFSKDTSDEYTRSFSRCTWNRDKSNEYSHSLDTHEMHIHMYTQCFLRTGL